MEQEINLLEKSWYASALKLTDRQWLEVFPEGKECLREKAKSLCAEWKFLKEIITESLQHIKNTKINSFTDWFRKEMIKTWFGFRYNFVNKEIRKLNRIFKIDKPTKEKEDWIPAYQIEQARNTPFSEVIEVNRSGFAKCPFHEEKHNSLYTRNNFYYCFGCMAHGDILDFVMKTRDLNFKQAIKYLT